MGTGRTRRVGAVDPSPEASEQSGATEGAATATDSSAEAGSSATTPSGEPGSSANTPGAAAGAGPGVAAGADIGPPSETSPEVPPATSGTSTMPPVATAPPSSPSTSGASTASPPVATVPSASSGAARTAPPIGTSSPATSGASTSGASTTASTVPAASGAAKTAPPIGTPPPPPPARTSTAPPSPSPALSRKEPPAPRNADVALDQRLRPSLLQPTRARDRRQAFARAVAKISSDLRVPISPQQALRDMPCGGWSGPDCSNLAVGIEIAKICAPVIASFHRKRTAEIVAVLLEAVAIHAVWHDAYGYVRRVKKKGPGYTYAGCIFSRCDPNDLKNGQVDGLVYQVGRLLGATRGPACGPDCTLGDP
jgi:hypothetical protein